jgi:hypothetical protein
MDRLQDGSMIEHPSAHERRGIAVTSGFQDTAAAQTVPVREQGAARCRAVGGLALRRARGAGGALRGGGILQDQNRGWNSQKRRGISATASVLILRNMLVCFMHRHVGESQPSPHEPSISYLEALRGSASTTRAQAATSGRSHRRLQSKRPFIESRWGSKPLAFAGELRPRRLNN